jgi:GNAT superfamily N-acetyltransferase
MSVTATINLLQARHATVSGVKGAPSVDKYVESLNGVELPFVLTWPEVGQWQQQASGGFRRQDRTYTVQVFVRPVAQGRGIGAALPVCTDLLQRFGELYLLPETIALANPPPYQVTVETEPGKIEDVGIVVLKYAGTDYHGFEFKVRVYEKW